MRKKNTKIKLPPNRKVNKASSEKNFKWTRKVANGISLNIKESSVKTLFKYLH